MPRSQAIATNIMSSKLCSTVTTHNGPDQEAKQDRKGKIGSVTPKDRVLRKIPMKDRGPVKYHRKVQPLTENHILSHFLTKNVFLTLT
jgi:hypothetical protein